MDFSVLGFYAEAIAIPVLYVETGLNPKTMDMAKTYANKIAREVAWKPSAKTLFIVFRWSGFQVYVDGELYNKFNFNPKINSRQALYRATKDAIILIRALYREGVIIVTKFINGVAVTITQ
jgi:hypothetical protein